MAFKKGNTIGMSTRFQKDHTGYTYWKNKNRSEETKEKIKLKHMGKHFSPETEFKEGRKVVKNKIWITNQSDSLKNFYQTSEGIKRKEEISKTMKKSRAKQILPLKDSSIEIITRDFLDDLKIEYFQHKYMNINHSYQCDFFVPSLKMVLEVDGDYWHKFPIGRDIDNIRTFELINKGFKVLRLWEHEIKVMSLNDFEKRLKGD